MRHLKAVTVRALVLAWAVYCRLRNGRWPDGIDTGKTPGAR